MTGAQRVFGFDLGTNSIGWAVLEEREGQATAVVDFGSRIFSKVTEDKTPTPKNQKRRAMRLARRLIQRRARRRQRLENFLIKLGFLPPDLRQADRERVLNGLGDPYTLRATGLDQPLAPFALGRAISHLGMRRGFRSSRKTLFADMLDDPDVAAVLADEESRQSPKTKSQQTSESTSKQEKDEGQFKAAINALQQDILAADCRTLGEYLAQLPVQVRRRNRRTGRDMLLHELRELLHAQAPHHPTLTPEVQAELENIIFSQRPLRWDRRSIGQCSLEKNRQRAACARLEYQEFRLLQDINHIRYDCPQTDNETGEIRGLGLALSANDRSKLVQRLQNQQEMSWSAVKKLLGFDKSICFNLEASKKGLTGNRTALAVQKIVGESVWQGWDAEQQAALVEDLLKFEKKLPLKNRLIQHWGFSGKTAVLLATLELEPGYANLSLKALRRLLPWLRQGLRYDEARVQAGYGYVVEKPAAQARLPLPPEIRNPVVSKALYEFRRVCHALLARYGQAAAIRIELPRELGLSGKRKAAFEKQQKANAKANEAASAKYEEIRQQNPGLALPTYAKKTDKLKYRLWCEQNGMSLYSGKAISLTQVFSAAVEVDHILPYQRSLDDSYLNKCLVFADENHAKADRTPYEAYSGNLVLWEQLEQRSRKLPPAKRERVLRQNLDGLDDFINSQLVDTAYLSREVLHYVQPLGGDVSVSKGVLTAYLRRQWGINSLLGAGEKNRADHRHHALDAVVIATVNRRFYQQLVHLLRHPSSHLDSINIPPPFTDFRQVLADKLPQLIVCHDPLRKVHGALHEETNYGLQRDSQGRERVVYRVPLDEKFNAKKISTDVLDAGLREQLLAHLSKFNNDPKVAFSPENRPCLSPHHAPTWRVRIRKADSFNPNSFLASKKAGRVIKLNPFGSNHHVEILRHRATGKIKGEFVNMWQAAQRLRQHQPLIQTAHGAEWEWLMVLHINDLVEIQDNGHTKIYRVQQLDPSNNRLMLREHTAAKTDDKSQELVPRVTALINTYKAKFLKVNVLGHRLP